MTGSSADVCVVILCWAEQYPKIKLTTDLLSKSLLEVTLKYAYECTSNVNICCQDSDVKHIEKYLLELFTTNNLDLCPIHSSKSVLSCLQQIQWAGNVVFLNPFVVSDIPLHSILRDYKGLSCDAYIPLVDTKVVEKLEKIGGRPLFSNQERFKWLVGLSNKKQLCYAATDDVKLKVHHSILNVFPKINFTRQYEVVPIMICKNWVFHWLMNQNYTDLHDAMIDLIESQYNPHLVSKKGILKYYKEELILSIQEALTLSTTRASDSENAKKEENGEPDLSDAICTMKKIKILPFIVPITQSHYIFDLQFEENVFEYVKIVIFD